MKSYDLIVIGGGSGGLATAQRAAEYGARVVLFEPARLGGTCVNVGCVPKKIMWNASELGQTLHLASEYGFAGVPSAGDHDWGRLKRGRDAYVARLNDIYARNLARKEIEVIPERARFAGPHRVVADSGVEVGAEHVLIATGGVPKVPSIPGAEFGITSDGFFELEARPDRVAIVGSGYIAVELGGVLRALGSEVTIFLRYDRVLRSFDTLIGDHLMAHMRSAGIEFVTGAVPSKVDRAGTLQLGLHDGRSANGFDTLIWAVGRAPNASSLALEAAGIEQTAIGHVPVDGFQNTNVTGHYAVGDVTGAPELTPVAIAAGRRLADRLFGGRPPRRMHYEVVPTVIFSHPPIGTIGLSETEARQQYADDEIRVYTAEFTPMLYALSEIKPKTAMKLVVAGAEERVVGCHVIGPGADEMTQGFAVAMTMGARKSDFDATIAIHPTSAEELVTMR